MRNAFARPRKASPATANGHDATPIAPPRAVAPANAKKAGRTIAAAEAATSSDPIWIAVKLSKWALPSGIAIAGAFSTPAIRSGSNIWARWFIWCADVFLGIRVVVRGRVPNESVIVASKHTSAYETILTLYLFHHPAVVMKAELREKYVNDGRRPTVVPE